MNPSTPSPTLDTAAPAAGSKEIISQSEIERLLAQVESVDPSAPSVEPQDGGNAPGREVIRRHDFPTLSLFSPAELRPLRVRHEDFISLLATRLSIHLGLEVGLQMSKLEAVTFQRFADTLSNPTYLTMLRLQPLAGICLLDIPPRLGLCIVDRELGGPGRAAEEMRQVGKIEARLLAPVVSLIINEWCGIWSDLMEVRPTVLGYECNSRDLRSSAPETSVLVVAVEAHIGEMVEPIQFAFPHPMLEPLTLRLNAGANGGDKPDAAAKAVPAARPCCAQP